MAIQEIYELIKQKKESAERDLKIETYNRQLKDTIFRDTHTAREDNLLGEIKAYEDVLDILDKSGLLDSKIYCDNYTINAHRK